MRPWPLLVILLCGAPPAPGGEAPPRLTFDVVFGEDPGGRRPAELAWGPGGRRLTYRWDDGSGEGLWLLDVGTGKAELLLHLGPAGGGEGDRPSLEAYHWSPRGDALLFEADRDLYLFDLEARELTQLTASEAEEEDPKFSPDGSRVAFVRDADLWVLELAGGRERALTRDGEEGAILNGKTDWVYWEEIWLRKGTGFWWSPDGSRIAYYRFDESPVATYPLVDFLPRYPTVEPQRYPKAGTENPLVRVGVLDLRSRRTTWMRTGDPGSWYLARVEWTPAGDRLAIQRLNRDQTRLDLLGCDPARGSCTPLLTEEWPTWVNLSDDLRFLADGSFLWSSERSGWRQLYLYDAAGRLIRQLTAGAAAVTSLDGVDEEAGRILYTATAPPLGAAGRRVFRTSLAGGPPEGLTPGRGWSEALAPTAGPYWVHTWSGADAPPELAVRRWDGSLAAELPATPPAGYDPAALPRWELFTLPGPEGSELPARMLRPQGFDPARRYPVLVYQYGGPGSQVVVDRWNDERHLWHKMMAQRGYAVLSVDNQASVFFGKPGEDRVHRRFGEVNLAAQLAAVRFLEGLSWVDSGRIGLWGWSGGGSNTLYCVLNRPGIWRAAVAGAPVTDWHLYDTIWTERYLDHPEDNATGYRDSSPVTHAHRLADPLLVVHGTADDNVHPQNTLVLGQALVAAGAPFDQAIYPRQKHGFKGEALRHFYERMTAFLDRHLRGVPEAP